MSLVIGASFAYFSSTQSGTGQFPVDVTTKTIDTVVFSTSKMQDGVEVSGPAEINIDATPDNFGMSNTDLKSEVSATVTLQTSNAANHTASMNYNLKLEITNNNFLYSLSSSQPDLLLKVIDPSGNEVTTLSGLTRKTVQNNKGETISGFDITKKTDTINIASSRAISTTTSSSGGSKTKVEKWKIKVILVNYSQIQNDVAGKSFTGSLILDKVNSQFLDEPNQKPAPNLNPSNGYNNQKL